MKMGFLSVAAALLALNGVVGDIHVKGPDQDKEAVKEAERLAEQLDQEENVKNSALDAKEAASVAKEAATVANKVADHSVKITTHAKSALKHALHALHDARVNSAVDSNQDASLQKAEAKLQDATKTADFGKLKKLEEVDEDKEKLQDELDRKKKRTELEQMKQDVKELRRKYDKKDAEGDRQLAELQKQLEELEKDNDSDKKTDAAVNDEMKAEIERLREEMDKKDKEEYMKDVKMKSLGRGARTEATPVEENGIDIDTQMPYGDLEPFGREDTAQELTESSVRESDQMVDQLERAEVAEEKRAVFRALTRLRGAAITSFDGVARSQTGNIDEYNKVNKWRRSHPLHHLADEESDVTKWAFPDNADLLQTPSKAAKAINATKPH